MSCQLPNINHLNVSFGYPNETKFANNVTMKLTALKGLYVVCHLSSDFRRIHCPRPASQVRVNGDGKATYTDQPCSAKNGERSADSNDQAIRKIQAVAQTKKYR